MNTTTDCIPKPNSYKTVIIADDTNKTLAEWVSLNQRTDNERREIAADMYAVLAATGEVK